VTGRRPEAAHERTRGGRAGEIGEGAMEIWRLRRAGMGKRENRWGGWLGGQQEVAGWIDGGDGD